MEEQIAGTALCGKKCILRVGEKWEEVNTTAEQHRKASISSSSLLQLCVAWAKLRILTDGESICARNTSLCYLRRKTYVKKWNRAYLTYTKYTVALWG